MFKKLLQEHRTDFGRHAQSSTAGHHTKLSVKEDVRNTLNGGGQQSSINRI